MVPNSIKFQEKSVGFFLSKKKIKVYGKFWHALICIYRISLQNITEYPGSGHMYLKRKHKEKCRMTVSFSVLVTKKKKKRRKTGEQIVSS